MGGKRHRRRSSRQTLTRALLALCGALALAAAFACAAYSAPEANTSGYEFTDASSGISYKVTVPAEPSSGAFGEVELMDGRGYSGSELSVGMVECEGCSYWVTALRYEAFKGNASLQRVVFTHDLAGVSDAKFGQLYSQCRAVGSGCFSSCPQLESVEFACGRVNGIGDEAFMSCGKLASLSFASGLEIFGEGKSFGIGIRAFAGCALTSVKVPAITCAKRTGDYYADYDHDYQLEPEDRDASGYMGCWHEKLEYFAIEARGICASAFANNPLETIVFEAGNEYGMYAYWSSAGAGLRYLPTLKSVVYEGTQPYYGDPNRSLNNGTAKQVWGLADTDEPGTPVAEPSFYYAVEFYATEEQAQLDGPVASGRIARVEYGRGTPVGAIQSADAATLAAWEYEDPAAYALTPADGTTPSPQACALAAQAAGEPGFEDAAEHSWIWMLDGTQSRRGGLSDSCRAYLVHADDLSAGRLGTPADGEDQMGTFYQLCDQNLSQGSTQASAFDHLRYYAHDSVYLFDEESVKTFIDLGKSNLREGTTPWFSLNSRGLSGLLAQMELYDGSGQALDLADETRFQVVLKTYNPQAAALEETSLQEVEEGPLLLCVQPLEGSGYSTQSRLEEWVLVKGQASSVKALYSDDAHDTWRRAVYSNGSGHANPVSFDVDKGFAVAVSSGDAAAALAAVSYAGLVRGPLSTVSSDSSYGFGLAWPGSYYTTGDIYGAIDSFERGEGETDAAFAASSYQLFNKNRERWGVDPGFQWGSTALLVNPAYLGDCAVAAASYAYACAAPVFYTKKNGSLGDKTAACLAGFERVLLLGDEQMLSASCLEAAGEALGGQGSAQRLQGAELANGMLERGNACALSIAMAQLLSCEGAPNSLGTVALVVMSGPDAVCDAASAMNFAGRMRGTALALASVADAKRVLAYLHAQRDDVSAVRLFGRSGKAASSGTFSFDDAIQRIWDEELPADAALQAGDNIELYGTQLSIGAGGSLDAGGAVHLWGLSGVPAGSYPYGTGDDGLPLTLSLAEPYEFTTQVASLPIAAAGLVYNATPQVGVPATKGAAVANGSARDAGSYTAVVTPREGYCWQDGSVTAMRISWSIEPASLKGARIALSQQQLPYTGRAVKPAVTRVSLLGGARIPPDDYSVTYRDNVGQGSASVIVTGTGNVTGSASAGFEITAPQEEPAHGADGSGENEEGAAAAAGSDTGDDGPGTDGSDGWTYFAPTGSAEASDTSLLPSVQTPPAVNIAILACCCLAFAAAIVYSTRARRDTDDLPEEAPHA
ncbi:MAG: leucine-rich repeat protein [Coriobacteriales bacterium]